MANTTSDKKDGTLATVALLSVISISIKIDEGLLVKLLSGLLVLALAGIGYAYSLHRHPGRSLVAECRGRFLAVVGVLRQLFKATGADRVHCVGLCFHMGFSRQEARLFREM